MNLAFWLSIILAASSCTGLIVAGRGKWQGWAIGLATQPVWAWFAIVTKSYGLLLVGVMYTTVYAKNLLKWRKDAKKPPAWWNHDPGKQIILSSGGTSVMEIQGLDMSDPENNMLLQDFLDWRKANSSLFETQSTPSWTLKLSD